MGFQKGHSYGVRFQPGRSGNPAGRPKSKTLSEALRALLEQPIDKSKGAPSFAEAIASAMLDKARGKRSKADVRAFEAVRDTVEGRPAQKVQMEGSLQISHEQRRQVTFLVHAIKKTQRQLEQELGEVTIEEAWAAVELVEREKFETDVSHLRPMVFAALGEGDDKTD